MLSHQQFFLIICLWMNQSRRSWLSHRPLFWLALPRSRWQCLGQRCSEGWGRCPSPWTPPPSCCPSPRRCHLATQRREKKSYHIEKHLDVLWMVLRWWYKYKHADMSKYRLSHHVVISMEGLCFEWSCSPVLTSAADELQYLYVWAGKPPESTVWGKPQRGFPSGFQ